MVDSDDDLDVRDARQDDSVPCRRQPAPSAPPPADRAEDVSAHHARLDSLLAERARSRFLAAAGQRLSRSLHPGRTARAVAELAVPELADAAVVVWPTPGHDGVGEWLARERGGLQSAGQVVVRALPAPVRDALRGLGAEPRPLLLDELADAPWAEVAGTAAPGTGAAVVALPGSVSPAGALVLVRRPGAAGGSATASAADVTLVEEFAQRAGIALGAAALYAQQAHTTAVLRSSLAQPPLPEVPGLTFGAAYRPADEGLLIGGDIYDVLPRIGDVTTFLLGDVCGKGIEAAVSTGQLRQSVLVLRRLVPDPLCMLEVLNTTMLENAPADRAPRFLTLLLGTATPRPDGGVALRLAGGGHPPPMVVRRGGQVEQIEVGGMLVGALREARFADCDLDLAPGESCVLYSDGVTEAHGGPDGHTPFGEERLAALLAGCEVLPAGGIADRVVQQASGWLGGGYRDDIAVLVVQAPLPAPGAGPRHRPGGTA